MKKVPVSNGVNKKAKMRTKVLPSFERQRVVRFATFGKDDVVSDHNPKQNNSYNEQTNHCRSKKDLGRIWYTHDDLNQIKIDSHTELLQHSKDIDKAKGDQENNSDASKPYLASTRFDTDDWSWRGFEYLLYKFPRLQKRKEHTLAVVEFQRTLNADSDATENPEKAIADFASSRTRESGCNKWAILLGKQDADEAAIVRMEPWEPRPTNIDNVTDESLDEDNEDSGDDNEDSGDNDEEETSEEQEEDIDDAASFVSSASEMSSDSCECAEPPTALPSINDVKILKEIMAKPK